MDEENQENVPESSNQHVKEGEASRTAPFPRVPESSDPPINLPSLDERSGLPHEEPEKGGNEEDPLASLWKREEEYGSKEADRAATDVLDVKEAADTRKEITIPPLVEEEERNFGGGRKMMLIGVFVAIGFFVVAGAGYFLFVANRGDDTPSEESSMDGGESKTSQESLESFTGEEEVSPKQVSELIPDYLIRERDEKRKEDLRVLFDSLSLYSLDHGVTYPKSEILDRIGPSYQSTLQPILIPAYMSSLPQDPKVEFFYGYRSDGSTFQLSAAMEDVSDPECIVEGNFCIYRINEKGEVVTKK